jgi:outer membrane protein OmpA-like peptidoglycan-associated protein
MTRFRLLLLGAAVPFIMIPATGAAPAQNRSAEQQIVVAQLEDNQARLSAAEEEVAAARQALEEAREADGDVAAAEARLEAAQADLAEAEAELQAAAEAEAEAEEPEVEEPVVEEPEVVEEPVVEEPVVEEPVVEEPVVEEPVVDEPEVEEPEVEEPEVEEPVVEEPEVEEPVVEEPVVEEPVVEEPEVEEPEVEEPEIEEPVVEEPVVEEPEVEEPVVEEPEVEEPEVEEPEVEEPEVEEPETQAEAEAEAEAESEAAVEAEAEDETAVEQQLEAQGDEEEATNIRELRQRLRRQRESVEQVQDEEADAEAVVEDRDLPEAERVERAERREERRRTGERRRRAAPPESEIVQDFGARFILRMGDNYYIRQDDTAETDRLLYRAQDVNVENIGRGRTRTTVTRVDGSQIITERDRYGDIILRIRVDPRGREFVLIDNRDFYRDDRRRDFVRFEVELPPLRIEIAREDYIVETRRADRSRIRQALMAPPVEQVERVYGLEEVRYSERLRDKLRRVDLDTITFEFGSAAIPPSQFDAVTEIGLVLESILDENPDELFLIEGHTDAVGSEYDNLLLSDRRAEAVAVMLSSNFDIPPENLIPQGYGEQFLKIDTQAPERQNRRVAIRRITELVRAQR